MSCPRRVDGALRARAIAHDDLAERDLVAPIDRERRCEPEVVRAAAVLHLLLTRQQRERALQLIVVGHERRRLGALLSTPNLQTLRCFRPTIFCQTAAAESASAEAESRIADARASIDASLSGVAGIVVVSDEDVAEAEQAVAEALAGGEL